MSLEEKVYDNTVQGRIEQVFDEAHTARAKMQYARRKMEDIEETVKLSNEDEYVGAKNGEIRTMLLRKWLSRDTNYEEVRERYRTARDEFRLAMLEVEKLRLQVAARP